jgi:S-adenosyl-L-methionine hydrolase (adenosine-forming)
MSRFYRRPITTPSAGRSVRNEVRPFVSLLSDFGARDPSAAIMRGVVLAIAPDALVVDVSHEVDKFAVKDGALLLWCALPYLPVGAHVAVIDPGVGTERYGIAVEVARGDVLVGPDNGLLLRAADRLGGITRAHLLENGQYRLPVVTSSFHGRDLFAPAAAHIALGVPIEAMGRPLDPTRLVRLAWPEAEILDGELVTAIVYLDTFGNVKLEGSLQHLIDALGPMEYGDPLELRLGGRERPVPVVWAETFGRVEPGQPLLYEDSYGRLCLAANQGSAVARLRLQDGQSVTIQRA